MATQSSGPISPYDIYFLGDYIFSMQQNDYPGDDPVTVGFKCTAKNGTKKSYGEARLIGSNYNIESWRVESNEDTATVYASVYRSESDISTNPLRKPIPHAPTAFVTTSNPVMKISHTWCSGSGVICLIKSVPMIYIGCKYTCLYASSSGSAVGHFTRNPPDIYTPSEDVNLTQTYTYDGRTVYYAVSTPLNNSQYGSVGSSSIPWCNDGQILEQWGLDLSRAAWYLVYGQPSSSSKELLVGRFEIEPDEADEDEWDDPGATGDSSYTLYIDVTGALSGRHNDPLNDTTYHYIPADQEEATNYGNGGNGGFGGGGGGGASTVIVYKCGTERAGSVTEYAKARRHGYGGGGGKGGKGGKGCILVYY